MMLILIILPFGLCSTFPRDKSDVDLNTVQMIENHGYLCENHEITTEDGYILTYQRIPPNKVDKNKPPVLLMHGILASSTYYVDMGPEDGLGYILANLGYDVWLANARGTAWSRRHKTLDIRADAETFFDFSWHEIGHYDLPAAVDHILNVTKQDNLYYVGHSQGGTVFLVFASTRPEYAKKIKLASLVAPASFLNHVDNRIFTAAAQNVHVFQEMTKLYGIFEVPFTRELQKFTSVACTKREFYLGCRLYFTFLGTNLLTPEINERLPVIFSHFPTHASIKQLIHFLQQGRHGGFRQYDYGVRKNREIYRQGTPPSYNLSEISIPIAVFYARDDHVVNYKDVKAMIQRLPNVVYEYLGPPGLGHNEFLFVKDMIHPVDGHLIKVLDKFK